VVVVHFVEIQNDSVGAPFLAYSYIVRVAFGSDSTTRWWGFRHVVVWVFGFSAFNTERGSRVILRRCCLFKERHAFKEDYFCVVNHGCLLGLRGFCERWCVLLLD